MARQAQNAVFAPTRFIDEHVMLSKSGEPILRFSLAGVDFETMADEDLQSVNNTILATMRGLPDEIRYLSYLVKLDNAWIPEAPKDCPALVRETVQRRVEHQQTRDGFGLFSVRLYLTLVWESEDAPLFAAFSKKLRISRKKLESRVASLYAAANTISKNLGKHLDLAVVDKHENFRFLRLLATLDPELAEQEVLDYDNHIDHWMSAVEIQPECSGLVMGSHRPAVLVMRKLPRMSWPHALRDILSIPANFIVCAQYKAQHNERTMAKVHAAQGHYDFIKYLKNPRDLATRLFQRGQTTNIVPDKTAKDAMADLDRTAVKLSRGETGGLFSWTILIFDKKNPARVETAAIQASKVVGSQLGSLVRETSYATGSWLSCIPGTAPRWTEKSRKRLKYLPLSQFVHLGCFYNHREGSRMNTLLRRPSLLTLESVDRTPIHFNLVLPKGNRTGVLLVGEPGSGKSMFSQLCIDQGQKDNPYTLILDGIGGSYKTLTRIHQGAYFELTPEQERWDFQLNPFQAVADSMAARQQLTMLVRMCLATGKFEEDAESIGIIFDEVKRVMRLPLSERRFSALKFPSHMQPYLNPWLEGNQYGFVFDNPVDSFALLRFQTIDFSGLRKYRDIVGPLLFHFFSLWDKTMYDDTLIGVPKNLWIDEGWDLLEHLGGRAYLEEALRTWRKRLGGLVFATQSLNELENAGLLEIMAELLPLKILMASPGANFEKYAKALHMNKRQMEIHAGLREPGSGLIVSAQWSKSFYTSLDAKAYWTYTNNPVDNPKRDAMIEKTGSLELALAELAAGR